MKFLREITEDITPIIVLNEETQQKEFRIKGCFMECGRPNRNGRYYSEEVMQNALRKYQPLIDSKRALGELNHPSNPQVNLDRVAMVIDSLNLSDDGKVLGEAKILNTPCGKIAQELLNEKVMLGLSSRALASVAMKGNIAYVQPDFHLTAIDIVSDPSGPECFINGLMESVDWIFDEEDGVYVIAEKMQNQVKKMSARQIEAKSLQIFEQFIKSL